MATGVPRCHVVNETAAGLFMGALAAKDELGGETQDSSSDVAIGVSMGLLGSVAINMGQNLQAMGLKALEDQSKPWLSKSWSIGMTIFIVGSMVNFAAFSFAPASVLVPLEAVQFVTNVIFNRYVNQTPVTLRMSIGVTLAVLGTVIAVVFGPNDNRCFTIHDMQQFWTKPAWWAYLIITLLIAIFSHLVHLKYKKASESGEPLSGHLYVLPVTFALSSALVGGAQMIVHSKAIAELSEILFLKLGTPDLLEPLPLATWYFWVEFTLLVVCGVVWLYKMNESLGLYDPLFIIPLMQSSYILFGVIAGGIYFEEFAGLSKRELFGAELGFGGWLLFGLGMFLILFGLYLIAPPRQQSGDSARSNLL
mmetsp:Transcript_25883/g.46814  ORF Transcript_25883/g.46814 Transcript_25883/m.46814 type:complete len:365 (-) Transcript_25883:53-1147(-)